MKEFKPGWWETDSSEIVPVFARVEDLEVGEEWVFVERVCSSSVAYSESFPSSYFQTVEVPMYFTRFIKPFDGSDPR